MAAPLQAGERVQIYRASYYNRRATVIGRGCDLCGTWQVRLDTGEVIECHRSDMEPVTMTPTPAAAR